MGKQMRGGGGVVCFELNADLTQSKKFMNALQLCLRAVSLGDPETLVSHPASMSASNVPEEKRLSLGITDGMIRLAVGLEHQQDIIDDLDQALHTAIAI